MKIKKTLRKIIQIGPNAYFNNACSAFKPGAVFFVYLDRVQYVPTMVDVFTHQNHV